MRCRQGHRYQNSHCIVQPLIPADNFKYTWLDMRSHYAFTCSLTFINLILPVMIHTKNSTTCETTSRQTISLLESSLGLDPSNLYKNGIAFGALPAFKEPLKPNTPDLINAKLPRPMSIMGDYVHLGEDEEGFETIDWHVKAIQRLQGNPVYQIALMPTKGLEHISQRVAERIAQKMYEVNQLNITVWLRWGHEMNGNWYKWGNNPKLFKEKWRLVSQAVKNRAPNTYMMWAPNVRYGDSIDSRRGGYSPYWPGGEYVDIAALSFYHFGGSRRKNTLPEPNEAIERLQEFSQLYGMQGEQKPIVIAETAAPYTKSFMSGWTSLEDEASESEEKIKLAWLNQIFSPEMKAAVPELKAISWFEIFKHETAPGGWFPKSEDFRLLLGNPSLSEKAVRFLTDESA
ncbi:hypothetical protein CROQUDRAFT_664468 [Cronartium quercuum f. sp. fusiforme G11]|uniref:GH26 domain-containing protein n=1 Tax=Cronartium quercuum f. sp. fusiforme G11 TaxID=708437 RepID=A0A9P6T6Z8_9BASI|nr:hypothetical protein CROQUDRAFT_664468 [Cronartium quercuum f. sp. fusiforme G11]